MARKRKRRTGEFEGATCSRCELPLDAKEGTCPNDRCPFHFVFQDEVVSGDQVPSEEEWKHIEQLHARLDTEA